MDQSAFGEVVLGDRDIGGGRNEGFEPLPRADREDRAGRDGKSSQSQVIWLACVRSVAAQQELWGGSGVVFSAF